MVLSWEPATVGVVATGVLAAVAVAAGALTRPAGALAAVFGGLIVILAGFPYLALLVLFVFGSSLATRYRFEEKRSRDLQEGRSGERGVSNVLAHVIIPTGLAVLSVLDAHFLTPARLSVLYTGAIAFGASDTFASEFGVLSGHAVSILTGRPVPPGTNGGVSATGEVWALIGAVTTSVFGVVLFAGFGGLPAPVLLYLGAGIGAGFLGCQVDSLLGLTLENRGYLTKGGTNFLGMLSAVGIAAAVLVLGGVLP
jgi:uncharacterized protein (TIGR00297 family)